MEVIKRVAPIFLFLAINLLICYFFIINVSSAQPTIVEKKYNGFTLWLDCEKHGAIAFYYQLGKDIGNISRHSSKFKIDFGVPEECQPTSSKSYRTDTVSLKSGTWDRGRLVPANHMDGNIESLSDTFYVTNILPQQSTFNQSKGAWHLTEKIAECYWDITPLNIWGGVIWGDDTTNDFFVESHGVLTPDYWWKVMVRQDTKKYMAWIFPNDKTATAKRIDSFLVSIETLKEKLSYIPDFGEFINEQNRTTWPVKGYQKLICEGRTTHNH